MEQSLPKKVLDSIEGKEKISSILILVIIMLLTIDYYSMFNFGFRFNHINYVINYKELITINLSIITILTLLAFLAKKHSLEFFLTLSMIFFIVLLQYEDKSLENIIFIAITYAITCLIALSGTDKFQNFIKEEHYISQEHTPYLVIFIKFVTSCFFVIFIITTYSNSNKNFNNIYYKNTEFFFKTNRIENLLFKEKIFTTNKLEKLQDDISFINSEIYVVKLKELNLLINNQLKINDEHFYSNYLRNDKFKTLFIVDKRTLSDKKINLYVIFTEKISKNEYQILDLLKNEINVIKDKTKS